MSELPSPFVPNDTYERIAKIDRARKRPPVSAARVKSAAIEYVSDPRTGILVALSNGRIVTP